MNELNALGETQAEYTTRILGYLEGREPMPLLASAPDRLAQLVEGISEEAALIRPAPGKWCVREIAAHMADDELVGGYRMRLILSKSGTEIQAFDQDRWAATGRYAEVSLPESLTLFRVLRAANLSLLESLEDAEWTAHGVHGERGVESIRDIAAYYAGHDINHLNQIDRILGSPER